MIQTLKYKLAGMLKREDQRSDKILKNVLLSFGVKAGSIVVGLLLVPLTINYINPVQYGIWLTISSVVSWMSFFDIGMGNGLRNKLAAAIALEQYDKAKKYVSTTYATLALISAALLLLLFLVNPLFDWRSILSIPASMAENMQSLVLIVFSAFCCQFVIQLINIVLTATHEPALSGLISFLGQLALLISVLILKYTVPGNLHLLVAVLTAVPLLVLLIASVVLYAGKLKRMAPSIKSVDFSYARDILQVGGSFFFIQIGALVLFQTDNIIITKLLGPQAVSEFNVAYKLFATVNMVFVIIVTPYWSAFTDAYTKHDFAWMRRNMNLMRKIWLLLSGMTLLLLFFAPWIFRLWLGHTLTVAPALSVAIAVYVVIYMWQTLHVFFLNGLGKIRLQLIWVTLSALVNIPLAIWLGKSWGNAGIISANTAVFFLMGILFYYQSELILTQKAKGIWAK